MKTARPVEESKLLLAIALKREPDKTWTTHEAAELVGLGVYHLRTLIKTTPTEERAPIVGKLRRSRRTGKPEVFFDAQKMRQLIDMLEQSQKAKVRLARQVGRWLDGKPPALPSPVPTQMPWDD